MKIIVAVACCIVVALNMASACSVTDGYEVHVINKLPDTMRLHCASGDDDLGYHNTSPNFDFNFSFCNSYTNKTLFFCHLWWKNQNVAFDVFTSKFGEKYCSQFKCFWEARPDGIYFSGGEEPKSFSHKYSWQNN